MHGKGEISLFAKAESPLATPAAVLLVPLLPFVPTMIPDDVKEGADRPLTPEEILNVIRTCVSNLDTDTSTYVGDLGELDAVLFTLHWIFATATGRLDEFVKAAKSESHDDFLRYKQLTESHEPVGASNGTQALLDRWKKRADAIGLNSS